MERGRPKRVLHLVAVVGLGLAGCSAQNPQSPVERLEVPALPPSLQSGNVVIVNDPAALEARITREARPLAVQPKSDPGTSDLGEASKPTEIGARLYLVGQVQAPVVDGLVVQANDIDIQGRVAVIAYNFAGDVFAGAVQVIDFDHPTHPTVVSEMLYRHADVDAVAMQGSHVYVGLASDDETLASPAFLEELAYTPGGGLEQTGLWIDLPSWSVTDLAVHGDDVLAGVGALEGGLALVSRSDGLRLAGFAPAADVRGVAVDEQDLLSVCGGDAKLLRHALPGFGLESEAAVDGYRQVGAKGTLEVWSHRCYLGAGEGGFQVRGQDGGLLAHLDNGQYAGIDPREAVTNGVSIANHLAFVAAGAGGVQVVHLGRYRCDGQDSLDPGGLRLLGQLALEDGASCNMVRARNDLLVVAGGAGGVKLVLMKFVR